MATPYNGTTKKFLNGAAHVSLCRSGGPNSMQSRLGNVYCRLCGEVEKIRVEEGIYSYGCDMREVRVLQHCHLL